MILAIETDSVDGPAEHSSFDISTSPTCKSRACSQTFGPLTFPYPRGLTITKYIDNMSVFTPHFQPYLF